MNRIIFDFEENQLNVSGQLAIFAVAGRTIRTSNNFTKDFVLFKLMLYVPVNIFSVMSGNFPGMNNH